MVPQAAVLKAGFHFQFVARTGTIACSRKQCYWLTLILFAKKFNLIQLPELTARSRVNARFQLGFRAAHALISHRLVARPNSPKWKPAFIHKPTADYLQVFVLVCCSLQIISHPDKIRVRAVSFCSSVPVERSRKHKNRVAKQKLAIY